MPDIVYRATDCTKAPTRRLAYSLLILTPTREDSTPTSSSSSTPWVPSTVLTDYEKAVHNVVCSVWAVVQHLDSASFTTSNACEVSKVEV